MKLLEERIRKDGIVRAGGVLKVDSFINHQMDIPLFREMAREWKRLFAGKPINKVLTIEASGIGIAAIVASELDVPVVFAKKAMSINLDYDNYETQIQSFTHKKIYNVIVSKKFLGPEDHLLIVDDFLANGCALMGLLDLAERAGATVEGHRHRSGKGLPARRRPGPRPRHPSGIPRHHRIHGRRHRRDRLPPPAPPELRLSHAKHPGKMCTGCTPSPGFSCFPPAGGVPF